jgi:hypothetical protein
MWPKNRKSMLPWITGVLLILATLSGCAEVEIVDKTPVASTPEHVASPLSGKGANHNLAVLAVDFDPPLSYKQLIIRRQAIALLVVVENRGAESEQDVVVRAQLSTPENPDFVLTQDASVASIAPGEVQIVRFARLGKIPYHQAYYLEVIADPVDGETDLSDNSKAFDIQIHQE